MDALPTELLLELPHHLTRLTDLVSLALTNRRFYLIFNSLLYERDAASPNPIAPFWGAEHGLLNTLRYSLAAGANLTQRRDFSRPRSMYGPRWRYGSPPLDPNQTLPALRKRNSMSVFLDRKAASTTLRYWWSPLDLAAFFGHANVVRFLVDEAQGALVLPESRGLCAFGLPWCARPGAESSSRSLPTWPSHTAAEAAQCAGHGEVAELLRGELGRVEQARTGSARRGARPSAPEDSGTGAGT